MSLRRRIGSSTWGRRAANGAGTWSDSDLRKKSQSCRALILGSILRTYSAATGQAARMAINRKLLIVGVGSLIFSLHLCAQTSTTHTTVRHHKEETGDQPNQML